MPLPTGTAPGYRLRVIVCVAANPSIDKLFEVDRLVPGGIHRPVLFVQTAGGKGLNAVRAAHTLRADVRAVGILRGHAGRWLEETLRAEGIDGAFVWADGENRSSLSVADRNGDELTEFYERGSPVPEGAWSGLIDAAAGLFAASLGVSRLRDLSAEPLGIAVGPPGRRRADHSPTAAGRRGFGPAVTTLSAGGR